MPTEDEKTFKVKWTVEEYSVSNSGWSDWDAWLPSDPIYVGAFGCTLWRIHTFPFADDGYVSCTMERYTNVEEYGDISIEFSVAILGKGGMIVHKTENFISDLSPKDHIYVHIVPIEHLLEDHFTNRQLVLLYEIRQIPSESRSDIFSGMWPDELKVLSDDMKRLLESGYRSDVILKSSDGRFIPVHLCVVIARWKKLQDVLKGRPKRPRVVVCPYVKGQILAPFLSYIYSGTIAASDVTIDLFEFVVKQFSDERIWFYSLPQEMSLRTIGVKRNVVFKWWYAADSVPFTRVLPLPSVGGAELVVDISTVGTYLDVQFYMSSVFETVHLYCMATLNNPKGRFQKSADYCFEEAFDLWHFPDFIPMSHLTDGSRGVHVVFELSVSTLPGWTVADSSTTEFQTGSLAVNHVEMLSSGLDHVFLQNNFLDLCDVELRTADGFFRGCKSVLGIRSQVLRELFRDEPRRSCVRLDVFGTEPDALAFVLEYLYTGWTRLWSAGQGFGIYILAKRLSLRGLIRKCIQFFGL